MAEEVPATITPITTTSISVNTCLSWLFEENMTVINGLLSKKT